MPQLNHATGSFVFWSNLEQPDHNQPTVYFKTNPLISWQLQLQKYICYFELSKARLRTQLTKGCSKVVKTTLKKVNLKSKLKCHQMDYFSKLSAISTLFPSVLMAEHAFLNWAGGKITSHLKIW